MRMQGALALGSVNMHRRRGIAELGPEAALVTALLMPPRLYIVRATLLPPAVTRRRRPPMPLSLFPPPSCRTPLQADYFYVPLQFACLFDVYGWNPLPAWPKDVHGAWRGRWHGGAGCVVDACF